MGEEGTAPYCCVHPRPHSHVGLVESVPSEGVHDNGVLCGGVIAEGNVANHNQTVTWVHDLTF